MKWTTVLITAGLGLLALYLVAERVWPASGFEEEGDESRSGAAYFPPVTASNLEGKRYALPGDFEGEVNLCLLAFTQEQQADVDTWLEGVKPLLDTPGLEVYELPTIDTSTPMFRGFLDGAMQRGIPDRRQRERTITLYLDKPAFRARLGLVDERRIYALLVDRAGNILWREEGRFGEEKSRSLRRALESGDARKP